MKRRHVLTAALSSTAVAFAGCGSSESPGNTYSLTMQPVDDDRVDGGSVLDFDRMGLANGQRVVVETAVEQDAYVESDVAWSTLPGRIPITMEFKTIIQRIARHVDPDGRIEPGLTIETPSRYERNPYLAGVHVTE